MIKLNLSFFGGGGASLRGGSSPASASVEASVPTMVEYMSQGMMENGSGRIVPVSESAIRSLVSGNINRDAPKIEQALNQASEGTTLTFNAYYSNGTQFQDSFTKTSQNTWEHSWQDSTGRVYWTNTMSPGRAASDIFNDINNNNR